MMTYELQVLLDVFNDSRQEPGDRLDAAREAGGRLHLWDGQMIDLDADQRRALRLIAGNPASPERAVARAAVA